MSTRAVNGAGATSNGSEQPKDFVFRMPADKAFIGVRILVNNAVQARNTQVASGGACSQRFREIDKVTAKRMLLDFLRGATNGNSIRVMTSQGMKPLPIFVKIRRTRRAGILFEVSPLYDAEYGADSVTARELLNIGRVPPPRTNQSSATSGTTNSGRDARYVNRRDPRVAVNRLQRQPNLRLV